VRTSSSASFNSWAKLRLAALVAVSVTGAVACTTTVQTAPERGSEKVETASILPVPQGRGTNGDSGVFLAYAFQGTPNVSENGCRLRLIEMSTRKSTFMNVRPGTTAAFVALQPGKYQTGNMGCTLTRVYDLKDILPGIIEVQPGSASYAGKLNFVFTGKDLTEVKRASRTEIAAAYAQALSVVPQGMPIVSAFSLTPLSNDMASEGAASKGWDVRGQGLKSGPALDGLLANLQKCEQQAGDPLRFGSLDYKAAYNGGRFTEFKNQKDVNAFPESFKTCVTSTLSSFRPPAKGAVEIQVIY
jgi:hypothetical protein